MEEVENLLAEITDQILVQNRTIKHLSAAVEILTRIVGNLRHDVNKLIENERTGVHYDFSN